MMYVIYNEAVFSSASPLEPAGKPAVRHQAAPVACPHDSAAAGCHSAAHFRPVARDALSHEPDPRATVGRHEGCCPQGEEAAVLHR